MWLIDLAFSLPVLIGFLVFGLFCEHNDARGWTIFSIIAATVIGLQIYNLPWILALYAAIPYVAIGVVWSFWRYKRHVSETVATFKEKGFVGSRSTADEITDMLHPSKMLGTIVAWIIVWPLSFIDSFIGDIINVIESLVTTVFKRVYFGIYDKAMASLKVDLSKSE